MNGLRDGAKLEFSLDTVWEAEDDFNEFKDTDTQELQVISSSSPSGAGWGEATPPTSLSTVSSDSCVCHCVCQPHNRLEQSNAEELMLVKEYTRHQLLDYELGFILSAQAVMEDYTALARNPRSTFCRRVASMSTIIKCPVCIVQKHGSADRMLFIIMHIKKAHRRNSGRLIFQLTKKHWKFLKYAKACILACQASMLDRYSYI